MPIRTYPGKQFQCWFVLFDLLLEDFRGIFIEIDMSIGMTSERLRSSPDFQGLGSIWVPFQLFRIDESVRGRRMKFPQSRDRLACDLHPSHACRKRAIQGQIIKGDGHLLCGTDRNSQKDEPEDDLHAESLHGSP